MLAEAEQLVLFEVEPRANPYRYTFEPVTGADGKERFDVWRDGVLMMRAQDDSGRLIPAPDELQRPVPPHAQPTVTRHVCPPRDNLHMVCACGRQS